MQLVAGLLKQTLRRRMLTHASYKVKFAPGIDKQNTTVGAEGRWVDCDNVRFRYQLPEKVGGWQSLVNRYYSWCS